MIRYAPNGLKLKIFVREHENTPEREPEKPFLKYFNVSPLTGEKAREFYETLVNDTSTPNLKPQNPPLKTPARKKPKQISSSSFKDSDLLAFAQRNDVSNLTKFFEQKPNCNINIVDDFGWTPLMCASCSGAEEAVKILLKNHADISIKDKLGYTALKLARRKNNMKIIELLESYGQPKNEVTVKKRIEKPEEYFCTLCQENVTIGKEKHESSTLHLFHCKLKTTTHYGIPECNKGFQLLLKEGWNKEKGLGPYGKGRKFPVKAVMKKDRTGIGAPPASAKRENQCFQQFENKKVRQYRSTKDKNFEKNFRLEFS